MNTTMNNQTYQYEYKYLSLTKPKPNYLFIKACTTIKLLTELIKNANVCNLWYLV